MNRNSAATMGKPAIPSSLPSGQEREISFLQAVWFALLDSIREYFEDFGERLLNDELTVRECLTLFLLGGLAAQIIILILRQF